MRVSVILPAAGLGTRMAGASASADRPAAKQFLTIGGLPVLIHSLRAFASVARVETVLLAVRATELERVSELVGQYELGGKVKVVEGGEHRQGSVANALAALRCDADDVVLVHDAVRPLIDAATIEKTIDAVERYGAAIVGDASGGYDQAGGADGGWSDYHVDHSARARGAGADAAGGPVWADAACVCRGGGGWVCRDG